MLIAQKRFFFLIILILFIYSINLAQTRAISGYIQDGKTGERLIGANIFENNLLIGTSTNNYGFFSITIPDSKSSLSLSVSYIGYKKVNLDLEYKPNLILEIELIPKTYKTEEIEVVGEAIDDIVTSTQMSNVNIPIKQIELLPALLGEVDILKVLQLLPGVQSGSEGSSGLYVRGGSPEQNLILLDGTTVYNANHLFGFFSIFNSDAIKNVNLIKGGFPARFGGRLSSVLELNMKEGNNKEFQGQASIGLISSKLTMEGPLVIDKTSFILSGRRTYVDLLMQPFLPEDEKGGYYFYDLNAKVNHIFSKKDRIYLSVYSGDDIFYATNNSNYDGYKSSDNFELGWGNVTAMFRWNHIFSNKLFANATANYSKFEFLTDIENSSQEPNEPERTNSAKYSSGIKDISTSIDFDYIPNSFNNIKFGANFTYHTFNPGVFQITYTNENDENRKFSQNYYASELRGYIEDELEITNNIKANVGLNTSLFFVKDKSYYSLEPRLSLRSLIGGYSVKLSYAQMNQYIHLLSNSGVGLPTDLWLPTTKNVIPEKSQQIALGLAKLFYNNSYEVSLEGYYKTMDNLIEYEEGASFMGIDTDWQEKITAGKGESYGAELFIQKKAGNTTGWIGYTLSWTNRKFNELNNGKTFPFKYDRRHDFSLVLSHKISDWFDASINWVYGTGNSISLPLEKFSGKGLYSDDYYYDYGSGFEELRHYESRNGYRMPSYHRLDVGCRFLWGEDNSSVLSISIYNVYSRKNPFFYFFDYDWQSDRDVLKQISLFPIIPSISYSFKF